MKTSRTLPGGRPFDGAAVAAPAPPAGSAATHAGRLRTYAELLVAVGVNLQPGQGLLVRAPVESAPLVREAVRTAYRLGAPQVEVMWSDDAITRARFELAPEGSFERVPQWRADGRLAMYRQGFASLAIVADDPDLLEGTDPARWATYIRAWQRVTRPGQAFTMHHRIPWCVAAYAGLAWARKVVPGVSDEQAVARLWDAIFASCRVDLPDPAGAWRDHARRLGAAAERLTARRYAALRFRAPGTDLRVGLADGHRWMGASARTAGGQPFVPNMPTEEVFTAPHRERVDGIVSASMPLASGGSVIEGLRLRFEAGRVVEARAERRQDELERILESDEGARSLGEVALVPASSPIARSGLLYYETLFDENAASHVALGEAYPNTVAGGDGMTEEEAAGAGLNASITHVDFMIGSAEMDVDGELPDGRVEAVMRAGEWAA